MALVCSPQRRSEFSTSDRVLGSRSCPLGVARSSNLARSGSRVLIGAAASATSSTRVGRVYDNPRVCALGRTSDNTSSNAIEPSSLDKRLSAELCQQRPDFCKVEEMISEAEITKTLIGHILSSSLGTDCSTALHKAVLAGSLVATRAFLDAGSSANTLNSMGRSPLHYACAANHPDLVRELLRKEADVNQISLGGSTPLHVACQYKADDCVAALLLQPQQYVMVDLEDDQRIPPERLAKNDLVRWMIQHYRENPYRICRKKWRLKYILSCLTKREQASFQTRLELLFVDGECGWKSQDECPICIEQFSVEKPYETLTCCHKVCNSCWLTWAKRAPSSVLFCPLCRGEGRLYDDSVPTWLA